MGGHPGHGGGWFGGLPREGHPHLPCRSPAFCCQARAFAFTQLSALSISKQRGLTFPMYLNTSCHSQWQSHQCQGPCRDLPVFPLSPQSGGAMPGAFPPTVFLSCHPHALPGDPGAGRGTSLPGLPWGTSWHPASVSQSAKPWTALTGPEMGKE